MRGACSPGDIWKLVSSPLWPLRGLLAVCSHRNLWHRYAQEGIRTKEPWTKPLKLWAQVHLPPFKLILLGTCYNNDKLANKAKNADTRKCQVTIQNLKLGKLSNIKRQTGHWETQTHNLYDFELQFQVWCCKLHRSVILPGWNCITQQ